jgi:hypothetical protein
MSRVQRSGDLLCSDEGDSSVLPNLSLRPDSANTQHLEDSLMTDMIWSDDDQGLYNDVSFGNMTAEDQIDETLSLCGSTSRPSSSLEYYRLPIYQIWESLGSSAQQVGIPSRAHWMASPNTKLTSLDHDYSFSQLENKDHQDLPDASYFTTRAMIEEEDLLPEDPSDKSGDLILDDLNHSLDDEYRDSYTPELHYGWLSHSGVAYHLDYSTDASSTLAHDQVGDSDDMDDILDL